MSLIAKENGSKISMIDEGIYTAVCSKVVDLGVQYDPRYDKSCQKVKIFWAIPDQTIEMNGRQVPREISKDFTNSLNEKSKLRSTLKAWRGKDFTPEELQRFDLKNVLGVACQVQVMHHTGEKGVYANVETVMAMPKGTAVPAIDEKIFFDIDDKETYPSFAALPRFVQEKISKAENFADTGLELSKVDSYSVNGTENNGYAPIDGDEDDLPM